MVKRPKSMGCAHMTWEEIEAEKRKDKRRMKILILVSLGIVVLLIATVIAEVIE